MRIIDILHKVSYHNDNITNIHFVCACHVDVTLAFAFVNTQFIFCSSVIAYFVLLSTTTSTNIICFCNNTTNIEFIVSCCSILHSIDYF